MKPTIEEVMETIMRVFNVDINEHTVDTLKVGKKDQPVEGIVTTFMATTEVIRKAADIGANLIITHEPIFYNHFDDIGKFLHSKAYLHKRILLEEENIAVWRIHDAMHSITPDMIVQGVAERLNWNSYADPENKYIFNIPEITLGGLMEYFKGKLSITMVRYCGEPEDKCKRVGLLVGAWGGEYQIKFLQNNNIDVLICGETDEWQTPEYIRDLRSADEKCMLLLLGHNKSEEAGMEYLNRLIINLLPEIPVTYIPSEDPLCYY